MAVEPELTSGQKAAITRQKRKVAKEKKDKKDAAKERIAVKKALINSGKDTGAPIKIPSETPPVEEITEGTPEVVPEAQTEVVPEGQLPPTTPATKEVKSEASTEEETFEEEPKQPARETSTEPVGEEKAPPPTPKFCIHSTNHSHAGKTYRLQCIKLFGHTGYHLGQFEHEDAEGRAKVMDQSWGAVNAY